MLGRDERLGTEELEDLGLLGVARIQLRQRIDDLGVEVVAEFGPRDPVVVEVRRSLEDQLHLVEVDGAVLDSRRPDLGVECAGLEGARLDERDRLVVCAAESRLTVEVVERDTGLLEEGLRHETARGRRLGSECERATGELREAVDVGHRLDPGVGPRDEHRRELCVDVTLRDRLGTVHLQASLYAGEPTEPHEIEVAHAERRNSGLVLGDRLEIDRHTDLVGEVIGEETVVAGDLLRILVGDRADRDLLDGCCLGIAARLGALCRFCCVGLGVLAARRGNETE